MDRLTERFSNGQAAVLGCGNNCKYDFKYCKTYNENCPTMTRIYEKLARYEDMEEQGKLLMLPCTPGDTVWLLVTDVAGISYTTPHKVKNLIYCVEVIPKFGKTVFLTEHEAKEALEGMKE